VTPTLAVQEQCLATNFIPFTIYVLFYRIVAIFKYSGYSETVKLGGVTNLDSCRDNIGLGVELLSFKTGPKLI
jgi:hypothetical protein